MSNSQNSSSQRFREWASLFSGKLFVQVVVYADESGTHHAEGTEPGSEVAVVAGFIGKKDGWIKFCRDWQAVLDKHSAKYFHFREFAIARSAAKKDKSLESKNAYKGWKLEKLDKFLHELAKIAADGSKIKAGGYVDTRRYSEYLKSNPRKPVGNPHEFAVWQFYESFIGALNAKWPKIQEPVSVFFDRCENREWRTAVDQVHFSYKKIDSRIKEITFADKKENLPLQAADMLAYRLRQVAAKYCKYEPTPDSLTEFDRILFGKTADDAFSSIFPS